MWLCQTKGPKLPKRRNPLQILFMNMVNAVVTITYLCNYCYNRWFYNVTHCKYNTLSYYLVGALYCYWLIRVSKMRLLWRFVCILWTFLMPVLIMTPIFGYKNCGQIRLVSNSCLSIMHTFQGSFKNANSMDSGFFQHTPVSSWNTTMFLIFWSCLYVVKFYSYETIHFSFHLLFMH